MPPLPYPTAHLGIRAYEGISIAINPLRVMKGDLSCFVVQVQ